MASEHFRRLDRGESWCQSALSWQSRVLFEQGRWTEATAVATEVVDARWEDAPVQIVVLTMLGRLRVRRGEPDAEGPLEAARELARRASDLQRTWPVAAALAESAWLAGLPDRLEELVAEPWLRWFTRHMRGGGVES